MNMKVLNLKESRVREKGESDNDVRRFWEKKNIVSEKCMWEIQSEHSILETERTLASMISRRKSAKSKKKKELVRDCMMMMKRRMTDWNWTRG